MKTLGLSFVNAAVFLTSVQNANLSATIRADLLLLLMYTPHRSDMYLYD